MKLLRWLVYKPLKLYAFICLNFYFRKYQIEGVGNIPQGPVIFAVNHQNAFLDAVLTACSSSRNPWFVTRGDVFKNPISAFFLSLLQMVPIYRFRDGLGQVRQNTKTFDKCVEVLARGGVVLIFPEANNDKRWTLRPLQRGVCRMAHQTIEQHPELPLQIVPVGIQYEHHNHYRTRVLVSFGKPVSAVFNKSQSTPEAMEELRLKIEDGLKPLILHIPDSVYDSVSAQFVAMRGEESNLVRQLKTDQELVEKLIAGEELTRETTAKTDWSKPLFWYSELNHFLPKTIIKILLKFLITDPQFQSSIQFAMGMFLLPFFYALQSYFVYYFTGNLAVALAYLVSIPLAAVFTRGEK